MKQTVVKTENRENRNQRQITKKPGKQKQRKRRNKEM